MKPDDVIAALRRVGAGRSRVNGLDVLNELLKGRSYVAQNDAREAFGVVLEQMKSAGMVRLPASSDLWDRGGRTPIPLWIALIRDPKVETSWSHRTHPWHPAMWFVAEMLIANHREDLLALDRWFRAMPADEPRVAIKERSWEIFGDEKRLEALLGTRLFDEGRLTLDTLRCYIVPHTPVHRIYPNAAPVMVISENEAGFDSFCRLADEFACYRCVVFGNGLAVEKTTEFLMETFRRQNIERCVYLGDVDAAGLAIPIRLNERIRLAGGLRVEPFEAAYSLMLPAGSAGISQPGEWLPPELNGRATALIEQGKRAAQESIGWKKLRAIVLQHPREVAGVRCPRSATPASPAGRTEGSTP